MARIIFITIALGVSVMRFMMIVVGFRMVRVGVVRVGMVRVMMGFVVVGMISAFAEIRGTMRFLGWTISRFGSTVSWLGRGSIGWFRCVVWFGFVICWLGRSIGSGFMVSGFGGMVRF